jgi:hypothetical protein
MLDKNILLENKYYLKSLNKKKQQQKIIYIISFASLFHLNLKKLFLVSNTSSEASNCL